jgi:hypothetical protein
MKNIIVCFVILSISFCGCMENNSYEIDIVIAPSSMGDFEYSISIKDGVLKSAVNKLVFIGGKFELDSVIEEKKLKLSSEQSEKLVNLIDNLKDESEYQIDKTMVVRDNWLFTLNVDGEGPMTAYNYELYEMANYNELKELLDFIIEISPIAIDLNGFAVMQTDFERALC